MSKIANPTKVITGVNTKWSYANVWDPKSINGGAPKYSVSLIIPKSDTVTVNKIKAAIQAAYEEGESKLKPLYNSRFKMIHKFIKFLCKLSYRCIISRQLFKINNTCIFEYLFYTLEKDIHIP